MRTHVVATALCVVALTACAGGPIGGRTASAPGVGAVAQTGRYTVAYTANGTRRDVLLATSGAFDRRRRRYSMEVSGSALEGRWASVPRRTIAIDGVAYVDYPALARRVGASTPWISMRMGGDDLLGVQSLDPTNILDTLGAHDAQVERGPDGLVRRVTMRFDAPGEDGVVLTVVYSDLGAPVTIEPPPPDQVTDETEALTHRSTRTGG